LQCSKGMIIFLRHDEIDRLRWDDCISRSCNRRIYAFTWYLDIVSPGWEALANDDYSAVFPLTRGEKAGISYVYQPFFAQQLGLFSVSSPDKDIATEFISRIPESFRYIDIQVTPDFRPEAEGLVLSRRVNHELLLDKTYEEVAAGYSKNTVRNIRKAAGQEVKSSEDVSPGELVKLFRENFGEKEGKLNRDHYSRMENLIKSGLKQRESSVYGAFDSKGGLSASAFFLRDGNRYYFLFAASAPAARENGAMFMLIDSFIREHSGTQSILDFEGGNDPSLGRFYKSFGSHEVPYHRISWNRLPVLLKAGLKLARSLRRNVK